MQPQITAIRCCAADNPAGPAALETCESCSALIVGFVAFLGCAPPRVTFHSAAGLAREQRQQSKGQTSESLPPSASHDWLRSSPSRSPQKQRPRKDSSRTSPRRGSPNCLAPL